ncbi:MAG: PqqD family protein [Acidobacteria bacterium]|jgi:hypothetical protein|nr:PqqD family protein [Acidobacteriota bacterium]
MQRAAHVAWQQVGDGVVVVDLKQHTATAFNDTGALVWIKLGEQTPGEIADHLVKEFGVAPERALADVESFLTGLASLGLIESDP